MADLPKVNPVNIVMESEKYYDFDPGGFQRALPTLKTVGGGIADLVVPQTATEVAMYAVPPVAVYNKVQKILNRANKLRAEAQSLFNSYLRGSRSNKDIREAQLKKNEADRMVKSISKEDKKIHDDYEKSLMGTKESNKRAADKARRIAAGEEKPDTGEIAKRLADPKYKAKKAKEIERDNLKLAKESGYDADEAKDIVNYYKGEKLVDDGYGNLRPERDFSDLPLTYKNPKLSRKFLEEQNFSNLDEIGYARPPKYSPEDISQQNTSNWFKELGENKYRLYQFNPQTGRYTQTTLDNPDLGTWRNFLGYAKGGPVDKPLYDDQRMI